MNYVSIAVTINFNLTDVTQTEGWHNFQMEKAELEKLALIKSTKKPRVAA